MCTEANFNHRCTRTAKENRPGMTTVERCGRIKPLLFVEMRALSQRCSRVSRTTSMPSLLSAYSSKLRMAVLMVRGGGSTVKPMLMALLRLESRTMISWRFPSTLAFCERDG